MMESKAGFFAWLIICFHQIVRLWIKNLEFQSDLGAGFVGVSLLGMYVTRWAQSHQLPGVSNKIFFSFTPTWGNDPI